MENRKSERRLGQIERQDSEQGACQNEEKLRL